MSPKVRRRPLVSGNWKMNFDHFEAIHAARDLGLRSTASAVATVDVSVHPPFTDLRSVQTVLEAENIPASLGAQNCAVEDAGAFTGEVSPLMLAKLHVNYVIVGHSERRTLFDESNEVVAAKLRAVLRNGMVPIVCVGESLDERNTGLANERLAGQVEEAITGLAPEAVASMVIAYEPIWAIGAGQAATPDDAQEACAWIREVVGRTAGPDPAESVRIQYGGSVAPDNTAELVGGDDIDGVLVGKASLDAATLVGIIDAVGGTVR